MLAYLKEFEANSKFFHFLQKASQKAVDTKKLDVQLELIEECQL